MTKLLNSFKKPSRKVMQLWGKVIVIALGGAALIWFLIRVLPKPSRASYPCQRAAFPLASAFAIWLTGTIGSIAAIKYLGKTFAKYRLVVSICAISTMVILIGWISIMPLGISETFGAIKADTSYVPAVGYDWQPGESNKPIGVAAGIFPGRVVMSRNPEATKWAGNWKKKEDQWWLDKNTDIEKVSDMLSVTLQKLTGTKKDKDAWDYIF